MLSRFSKKQKYIALGGILVTIVSHYVITGYQEVGRLKAMLAHDNPDLKIRAAEELGQLGYRGSSAVEELGLLVNDSDETVRKAATSALAKIDRDYAVDILVDALGNKNAAVRLDAAETLEHLGSRRGYEAAQLAQRRSNEKYQRTRLKSWASDFRAKQKKEKKEKYRQHRKIYGD